jgi:hypothetical protein
MWLFSLQFAFSFVIWKYILISFRLSSFQIVIRQHFEVNNCKNQVSSFVGLVVGPFFVLKILVWSLQFRLDMSKKITIKCVCLFGDIFILTNPRHPWWKVLSIGAARFLEENPSFSVENYCIKDSLFRRSYTNSFPGRSTHIRKVYLSKLNTKIFLLNWLSWFYAKA